jgi:hypothetical protein
MNGRTCFENRDRQNLQTGIKRSVEFEIFFDDGDQNISGNGAPDLSLDGVLAGGQEPLDPQVLLDPFEEQFNLPAVLVELSNR